ncbi:hypothetical protein EF847_05795 [Actinobacteria bacterium YIM 96077]|uniref:MoaB/Mog domain-containing protein n=1 Tax=Phytoactinopolyspora halophila TaxID=1981511 RepID=A0A329QN72_9ACTN|nr:molybdopterin-binding protein [Phytoactinopolyspora halophila]AYY12292.1 hypothetical protein EF847_05795 [Actinobacteria bacterium YIM 96077]RAW13790.1 hypothetical protein DPM12_12360 [Phytoactinopolyspora halophila]
MNGTRPAVRVGICSIGSELLGGDVVDTNAAWLARRAVEAGAAPSATVVVGDDHDQIIGALGWLAGRCDVIVAAGGLGPTADDLTRDAVADIAGVALHRDDGLVRHLHQTYARLERPVPTDALHQADIPAGATVHEPRGTAAGFSLDLAAGEGHRRLHVLPGVPWEYRELAERVVLPELIRRSGGASRVTRTLHVTGMGESAVGEALRDVSARLATARLDPGHPEHGVELSFLATDDDVLVRFTASAASPDAARQRASAYADEAAERLGDMVASTDDRVEHDVARMLHRHGTTIGTAEGFTAGRICATVSGALAAIRDPEGGTPRGTPPGAGELLRGGIIAHTPPMLAGLFGLGDDQLASGVASPGVVEQMARQAQDRLGADVALGVDVDTDVSTVRWAIVLPDRTVRTGHQFIPGGDPDTVRARSTGLALDALRRELSQLRRRSG